jgi:predicted metal-dependent enzyme (double-stranded beta helix superfamily)
MKKLYNTIETILLTDNPLLTQLKLLRDLLTESLRSDEFRINCIEELLNTIPKDMDTPWSVPAFFYHEQLKYSVRMIFWPAFYENNPHEHKTWSVTGVFSNFLSISTYELLSDLKRLKRDRVFDAIAGQVGYLVPGCIHSVKNPTHELSGSIHIFNNIDYSNPEENAIWYPAPRKYNLTKGLVERALTVCLIVLRDIKQERTLKIIQRIYNIGSIPIKLLAIQAMYSFNRGCAKEYFEKLEITL